MVRDRLRLVSPFYAEKYVEVIFCTLSVQIAHKAGMKKIDGSQMGLYSKVVTYFFL